MAICPPHRHPPPPQPTQHTPTNQTQKQTHRPQRRRQQEHRPRPLQRRQLPRQLQRPELDQRVVLRPHPLPARPVVVGAGLAVQRREHRVPLVLDDLALLVQRPVLPADERVVEGVHVGGDERAAPVDAAAHGAHVALGERGEVAEPVGGVAGGGGKKVVGCVFWGVKEDWVGLGASLLMLFSLWQGGWERPQQTLPNVFARRQQLLLIIRASAQPQPQPQLNHHNHHDSSELDQTQTQTETQTH